MNSNVSEKDLSPTSAHSSSKPQARFTMMTPSASPPIQQPYRQQSRGPPPSKKRRMSSTPSLLSTGARNFSTVSRSSSSVPSSFSSDSTLDPLNELDAARRASSNKVLSVWSQLAAKYARRLDEDDIVDLRKEKIIKDNGVLRSTNHMYEIGCFAEQHEQEERDKPPVPADDEPDEIDAFAETSDNLSHTDTDGEDIGLELMQQSKRLPPVRELDPDDAADLAEFLEAEELQKDGLRDLDTEAAESFDEEGDEYETSDDEKRLTLDTRTSVEFVHREDDNEAIAKGNNYKTTDYLAPLNDEYEAEDSTPSPISYHLISKPSGSPELDTPGIIYSNQEYEGEDSDEVEIISWPKPSEVPHTTGQSSPLMADGDSEDELGIWEQDDGVLYSSDVTPGIDTVVEQDSKEARSPTPTLELCTPQHRINSQTEITRFLTHTEQSTKAKKTPKSRLKGKLSQTPTQPPSPPVQLQTPPRSSSFGPGSSKKNVSVTYSRKRTHETPAKKALRRVETSSSENSNTELEPEQKKMTSSKLSRTTQRSSSKPKKKSGSVSEDTVDDGSPRSRSPTRKAIKEVLSEGFSPGVHTKSSKAKGKEREIYSTIPSRLRLQSPRKGILESTPVSTPKQNASVRKRKRFTSPMETDADESPTDHVVMVAPSPSKTSTRKASSRQRLGKDNSPRGSSKMGRTSLQHPRSRASISPAASDNSTPSSPSRKSFNTGLFSFTPPKDTPSLPFSTIIPQRELSVPLPNLQDPAAQYHLAQALQSLTFLMGGSLPYSLPTNPEHQTYDHPGNLHTQHMQLPTTPRRRHRDFAFGTPSSGAAAPPTSSPVGSDYSDSLPSSPVKYSDRSRHMSRSQVRDYSIERPRSAMRSVSRPRSRRYVERRVSFSSPEATHIEDSPVEESYSESRSDQEEDDAVSNRPRQGRGLTPARSLSNKQLEEIRYHTPVPVTRYSKKTTKEDSEQNRPDSEENERNLGLSHAKLPREKRGRR